MSFLDSAGGGPEEEGAGPPPPQPGGPPGGARPPGNPMAGGGPILSSILNRQQGQQVTAPGRGDMGQATALVTHAYGLLKQAVSGLLPGSPIEQDVLKMIQRLARHLPQGQPTAGVQQTQLLDMLRNVMKNALLQKIMAQMSGGGQRGRPQEQVQVGGPGGGAPQIPGAMAQAPMPSTPLPGA